MRRTRLPDLDQVAAADAAVLGIVEQEVSEFAALLDEMDVGEAGDALAEVLDAHHFAEHDAGVVEAESLVEVADQKT